MNALQVLALVALGVTALLCLRFPDTVARILASNVRPRVGQEPGTKSQELARLIRQGSSEWKTLFPEFYGVIKGIGYIAIGFLAFLLVALIGNALLG